MHCLSPPSYSYHYYFLTSLIIRKRYVLLSNTACEVMYVAMYCLRHWALEGEMRIVSFRGTLGIHALNYVTSLVILGIHALKYVTSLLVLLRLAYRLGGDHADGMYEIRNGLVRLFTAILTHLPVLPFPNYFFSQINICYTLYRYLLHKGTGGLHLHFYYELLVLIVHTWHYSTWLLLIG